MSEEKHENLVERDVPPIPFWRNSLIILVGPSGSGKSTFAKKHFPPTMTVSTDHCRAMVCDTPSNQKVSDDAFEIFYFILEKRMKNGYPAVADSTALRKKYRQRLTDMASRYCFSTVLLFFDLPFDFCERNDQGRRFTVGEEVQKNQFRSIENTRKEIEEERYDRVVVLKTKEELDRFSYRWSSPLVERDFEGPLDIIGDVHGCYDALVSLLRLLGYSGMEEGTVVHSSGRKAVFLGDIMDRGGQNLKTLDLVYRMWKGASAFYVPGNHCNKLFRHCNGGKVVVSDGMEKTIEEFQKAPEVEMAVWKEKFLELYTQAPPYLVFDHGRLVVSHAGILDKYIGRTDRKVWSCCLYGPSSLSSSQEVQKDDWVWSRQEKTAIVYGHLPVAQAVWKKDTIDIDLGAGHGGKLCALRYPEKETVAVDTV